MTNEQSSVYRSIERLYMWQRTAINRTPKTMSYALECREVASAMLDALTACANALRQPNLQERLELISVITMSISRVSVVMKIWHQDSQWTDGCSTKKARVLSSKQYAYYCTEVESLDRGLKGWAKDTVKRMSHPAGSAAGTERNG